MIRLTERNKHTGKAILKNLPNYCEYDPIERLAYYEDLEEQGRLVVLEEADEYPCKHCGVGWGSISSEGYHGCEEFCERLKEYNKKYSI